MREIFEDPEGRRRGEPDRFTEAEVRLANRNSGVLLETLRGEITPTGAHYLLIHFDVPALDETHRLSFGAGFEAPYELSMDEIRALPQVTRAVTMECAGNGRRGVVPRSTSMPWGYEAVGTALWTGTPLAPLIERARPGPGTVEIAFEGADRGFDDGHEHAFGRSLTLDQIAELEVLLVHEMNGAPLLPQHGAPLRIVVPGWYGMASVKWLARVEALTEPYRGFQQVRTYRYREGPDDPGRPVTALRVKSLMVPPGVPDWLTRARCVRPGPVTITGRAWSRAPIVRVELGVGDDWRDATLTPPPGPHAWTGWSAVWDAAPGEHVLRCRATDAGGAIQPLEARWDYGGFGNNVVQEVPVWVPE